MEKTKLSAQLKMGDYVPLECKLPPLEPNLHSTSNLLPIEIDEGVRWGCLPAPKKNLNEHVWPPARVNSCLRRASNYILGVIQHVVSVQPGLQILRSLSGVDAPRQVACHDNIAESLCGAIYHTYNTDWRRLFAITPAPPDTPKTKHTKKNAKSIASMGG